MKLAPAAFVAIGFALAVVAIAYAYFYYYEPKMATAASFNEVSDQLDAVIAQAPNAQKRVEEANAKVQEAVDRWNAIAIRKTPPADWKQAGVDLNINAWQVTNMSIPYRNMLQKAINQQVKAGGVKVINGPLVPNFSRNASDILRVNYNYPVLQFPVVFVGPSTVVVRGTYNQIMSNVRAWNHMPNYLAMATNLRITGTSPELTGTYQVMIVGYVRGQEIFPPVPQGTPAGLRLRDPGIPTGGGSPGDPNAAPGGPGVNPAPPMGVDDEDR
jgi:hypothetical protein